MSNWLHTVKDLKLRYPELHYHYSSKERWCVVSFKGKSVTVFDWCNKFEIDALINKLKM